MFYAIVLGLLRAGLFMINRRVTLVSLLLLASLFYAIHGRHEIRRIWRQHAARSETFRRARRHVRGLIELLAAFPQSIVIIALPTYYALEAATEWVDGADA